MTEETFKKACEIDKKIKDYKKFLRNFNSPYTNIIRANNYIGDSESWSILTLSNEPELEILIRGYITGVIEALEQEFAKIN